MPFDPSTEGLPDHYRPDVRKARGQWYSLQSAYWGLKWAGYAFNPIQEFSPKMRECARLSAHFSILAYNYGDERT